MIDKTVFQLSMMLVSFGVSLIAFQHRISHMIIDLHIHMVHLLLFFTSELQFSYMFTYKNVL